MPPKYHRSNIEIYQLIFKCCSDDVAWVAGGIKQDEAFVIYVHVVGPAELLEAEVCFSPRLFGDTSARLKTEYQGKQPVA